MSIPVPHQSALPVLLTSEQVSNLLSEHPAVERLRRMHGTGPKFIKIGRKIRYRVEDVNDWLSSLPNGGKRGRGRPRKQVTGA